MMGFVIGIFTLFIAVMILFYVLDIVGEGYENK